MRSVEKITRDCNVCRCFLVVVVSLGVKVAARSVQGANFFKSVRTTSLQNVDNMYFARLKTETEKINDTGKWMLDKLLCCALLTWV